METVILQREFTLEKGSSRTALPDPSPAMSAVEVGKFYSRQYPELLNSTMVGPVYEGDKAKYTFKTVVGTKG